MAASADGSGGRGSRQLRLGFVWSLESGAVVELEGEETSRRRERGEESSAAVGGCCFAAEPCLRPPRASLATTVREKACLLFLPALFSLSFTISPLIFFFYFNKYSLQILIVDVVNFFIMVDYLFY
jgi:hypothetical protein